MKFEIESKFNIGDKVKFKYEVDFIGTKHTAEGKIIQARLTKFSIDYLIELEDLSREWVYESHCELVYDNW